jgi:formate dehydrogenase maturation protein FdhE
VKTIGPERLPALFATRAERAETLAKVSDVAREPLLFAAALNRAQGEAVGKLLASHRVRAWTGRIEQDRAQIGAHAQGVLEAIGRSGPSGIAERARRFGETLRTEGEDHLERYLAGENDEYLCRAVLRPYFELLAALDIAPLALGRSGDCPFCHGAAWISIRRASPESDGALSFAGCALCGRERQVARIRCLACGKTDPDALPVYQSTAHLIARIEACDTCRAYVKSIDLTEDARPIPEIDELASISLDLWAAEQGYRRLEPGLAGL